MHIISFAFELLQVALGSRDKLSRLLSYEEWDELLEFAKKQAIVGVLFAGIEKLPSEQRPPLAKLVFWIKVMERNRTEAEVLDKYCRELTDWFAKEGYDTCVLKGQSNATLYPENMVRTTGDIDLLVTDPKAKDFYESRKHVIQLIRQLFPYPVIVQYHHIELRRIENISIEIHYTPVVAFGFFRNRRLQKYLWKHQETNYDQVKGFNHLNTVTNLVFQLQHIFKHLIIEGVGLRQVVDYFWLLKHATQEEREEATQLIHSFGLTLFAGALMYVLKECCGLEDEYLLVKPDIRRGRYFKKELLIGGNFGRNDTRFNKKAGSKVHNFFMLSHLSMRNFWYFPFESFISPIERAMSGFQKYE